MTAVEFKGEEFTPRANTNQMRVLQLAKAATQQEGGAVVNVWAAQYDVLEGLLAAEDFERFMSVCDREGATDGELYEFIAKMIGAAAQRPTVQPSDSSPGPSPIPATSDGRLEELATERFPGRPDLVLAAAPSMWEKSA
jgi:hypothetical protein